MKIGIFAFATSAVFFKEVISLAKMRGEEIEWSVVIPQAPFRHYFNDLVERDRILYIYESFNDAFAEAKGNPELTSSDDNINRILATDKNGYRHETKEFQYRWAEAMIATYRAFLSRTRPNFILFPNIETVEGSLLSNLCQEMGIGVMNSVHMRGLGLSFFSPSQYECLPACFGDSNESDRLKARTFLENIKAEPPPAVRYPTLKRTGDKASYRLQHIVWRTLRGLLDSVRQERWYRTEDGIANRIKRNMIGPLYALRRLRYRMEHDRLFDVTPRRGKLPSRFILYAAQVTPEQTINAMAQFYIDQERVIDLLRLHMPHGYVLVVKEHPGMMGVRPRSYYRRLRRMAGIVMASPEMQINQLAGQADLVATVTGTIGLECWLLNRPCLMFGPGFFQRLCFSADAVESLKDKIIQIISKYQSPSQETKIIELAKFYNIAHPFVLFDPISCPYTLERENITNYLEAALSHIVRVHSHSPKLASGHNVKEVEDRRHEILHPLRNA